MDWIEAAVKTTTEGIEPVSGVLMMHGISGFAVEDQNDLDEFLREKSVYWDYIDEALLERRESGTVLTFYVENNASGLEKLSEIKGALARLSDDDPDGSCGTLEISVKNIAEEDWANNWKQYFKPLPVGKKLLIKPTWENAGAYPDRTVVEIDPSSSFGTGAHATTRLCLEYVEEVCGMLSGKLDPTLDLGCGSGILGIAAHKLSGAQITAVDIDEGAVRVAKENFDTNRIGNAHVSFYQGSITDDPTLLRTIGAVKYRLITANIVADVLIAMAASMRSLIDENGFAVLSGILSERADEVEKAFAGAAFRAVSRREADGWTALLVRPLPCEPAQ